ncbi:hypothetical protein DK926_18685 [Rhodococcus sp. Eu-32]|uniref:hypothetical protein n=1 Tax=Rhodococcus sp. Eu-32 TaxID=1017319 RepID=UPI000DF1B14D|nr:hypothetical protein [Rhodococcus sp. Eu-32]RRQ26275.1 hypothetical protein DK926_18685 [Rhodococcus sp. Eu-32]
MTTIDLDPTPVRTLDPDKMSFEEIEAALDSLPVRAVVSCDAVDEPGVFIKPDPAEWPTLPAGSWMGAGSLKPYTSRLVARYCGKLTVLR